MIADMLVPVSCVVFVHAQLFSPFSQPRLHATRTFDMIAMLSATKAGRVKGDLAGSGESALASEKQGCLFVAALRARVREIAGLGKYSAIEGCVPWRSRWVRKRITDYEANVRAPQ